MPRPPAIAKRPIRPPSNCCWFAPRFGERKAIDWLDVARNVHTQGFNNDAERSMLRWRDWVVRAFNQDLFQDRFVAEPLAGDLPDNPALEQRIATGFGRDTPSIPRTASSTKNTSSNMWLIASAPSVWSGSASPSNVPAATIVNLIRSRRRITTACMPFSITHP